MPKKDEKSGAKKTPVLPKKEDQPKAAPTVTLKNTKVKFVPPTPKKKPEPKITFARWFRSKKFKPHWAAGMEAYTDTKRARTVADWDRLFKAY